jgi:hypothetical protein
LACPTEINERIRGKTALQVLDEAAGPSSSLTRYAAQQALGSNKGGMIRFTRPLGGDAA